MTPTPACPREEELAAFASGQLPSVDVDRLAEHIQSCPVCQRQLSGFGPRGESLLTVIRSGEPSASLSPVADQQTVEHFSVPESESKSESESESKPESESERVPAVALNPFGSTPRLESEICELLRFRLRAMASVGSVVFLFFVSERVLEPIRHTQVPRQWTWADQGAMIFTTVALVVAASVLWLRPRLNLRALRVVELLSVFSVSMSLAGTRYTTLIAAEPGLSLEHAILLSNMAWYFVLAFYGVFIPNTLRRCLVVLAVLGLVPVVVVLLAAGVNPVVAERLPMLLGVTGIGLFMIGSLAAFGSFKISTLQQEAFIARQQARELGQYRLTHRIGAGGMGEVWLAEHRLLKRPCAVKLIRPQKAGDPDHLRRFEREVRATAQLRHPNTVEIYDYGHAEDGTFYYVMEFLTGLTLDELVRRSGPLPEGRAIHILRQLCAALRAAHGIGLVHRDIKPSNVMISPGGSPHDRVKLLDFGLVRPVSGGSESRLTQDGIAVGTPEYMSPEQVEGVGAIDGRSDLYNVGALAYFLLAGRPPFQGGSVMQLLVAHLREPAPPLRTHRPEVSEELASIVNRCLAKKAVERFENAAELDQALAVCDCAGRWKEVEAVAWWREQEARSAPQPDMPSGQ